MLPGPVFFSELITASRRVRLYVVRTIVGLLLLYFVVQSFVGWSDYRGIEAGSREFTLSEVARLGSQIFITVLCLQGATVLFLTPVLLAGSIAEDRHRKVIDYLLASPLTGAEIVLGKVAARLINLVVLVSVGLPVMSIALLFGGVEPWLLFLSYAATLSTTYFLAGLSMAVSSVSARPRDAITLAILLELGWLFFPLVQWLPLVFPGLLSAILREINPFLDWITCTSPLYLLAPTRGGPAAPPPETIEWLIGLQLVYGTILLAWATFSLRPMEKGTLRLPTGLTVRRGSGSWRLFRRRPCGDSPMIWKECTGVLTSKGPLHTAILVLSAAFLTAGLGYWLFTLGIPAWEELASYGYGSSGTYAARGNMSVSVRVLTAILYIMAAFVLAGAAATGITFEREKDTWVSLVSTSLEGGEIVHAKILGAFWRTRWVLGALVLVWLIGAILGAVHPLAVLLAVFVTVIDTFFIATLGTFVSLGVKNSVRALSVTMAILIVLNGGYLFCCIPFRMDSGVLAFFAVTPMVVTMSPFDYRELGWYMTISDREINEFPYSCLANVVAYGCAAMVFLALCHSRFDADVDRPRRSSGQGGKSPSCEGIAFLEEKPEEEQPR